jgi:hypothetical protein
MGKIQCISLRATPNETWTRIENELNNKNCSYEKRIFKEFNFLREKVVANTMKRSHEEEPDFYFDNITAKIYTCSPSINLKKRMRRFIKWYKMSTYNQTLNKDQAKDQAINQTKSKRLSNASLSSFTVNLNIEFEDKIESNLLESYQDNKEKFLVRVSKGPPNCFRWKSWKIIKNVNNKINEEIFLHYLSLIADEQSDTQIKKDLNRTFTSDAHFNTETNQKSLYRVLKAFANLDKKVGYCQGMNFLASFLLLQSEFNEIETFFMLLSLFENTKENTVNNSVIEKKDHNYFYFGNVFIRHSIRGFFLSDFPMLKFFIHVFEDYLYKKVFHLYEHFKKIELPNEVWISKWLQTLFTISLPLHAVIRLWDCVMVHGPLFMVYFALGIVKIKEYELEKLNEAFDIVDFFKSYLYNESLDVEDIISLASKIMQNNDLTTIQRDFEEKHKIILTDYEIKYDLCKPIESQSVIKKGDISLDSLSYGDFIHSNIECEEEQAANTLILEEVAQKRINSLDNGNFSLILKTTKNTDTVNSKANPEGNIISLSETQKDYEDSSCYDVDVEENHLDTKVNGYRMNPSAMARLK